MKLSRIIRSAFVIGRRDFTATVMSKTFLLFLLGPLFPLLMAAAFGGIGAQIEQEAQRPVVAVVASPEAFAPLRLSRDQLAEVVRGERVVGITRVDPPADPQQLLKQEKPPVIGVLEVGPGRPRFTGAVLADGPTVRQMQWILNEARRAEAGPARAEVPLLVTLAKRSAGSVASARSLTARAGQALLFVLTILLAGMLLSQLIEEKSNKVIEILAAAVPVDAIFLGKLFAMLAMSLVGIAVWSAAGAGAIALWTEGGLAALPEPAVGWPAFLALVAVYFAMSYLLIGAVFLGIGGQASSAREVQTLSMPVTMAQVVLFAFASIGVGKPGSMEAIAAAVFPLSSPFAMLGRAAEVPALWPHVLALAWQALWVGLILHLAAGLFRRSVLKSGQPFRWPWRRRTG